ncbi:MAG: phospholipase D-like domain-containing protein, partial [Methanotrichaceae archaeon]
IIIADGLKGFVGSENFSPTSLDKNRELGILIDNSGIIQTVSSTFDVDWNSGNQIQKIYPNKVPKRIKGGRISY